MGYGLVKHTIPFGCASLARPRSGSGQWAPQVLEPSANLIPAGPAPGPRHDAPPLPGPYLPGTPESVKFTPINSQGWAGGGRLGGPSEFWEA